MMLKHFVSLFILYLNLILYDLNYLYIDKIILKILLFSLIYLVSTKTVNLPFNKVSLPPNLGLNSIKFSELSIKIYARLENT